MIHLSLFPNTKCTICDCDVEKYWLHCIDCETLWIELNEKD